MRRKLRKTDLNAMMKCFSNRGDACLAIALKDLVALGCHAHREGRRREGRKACRAALLAAGMENGRAWEIVRRLAGNEDELLRVVRPHVEMKSRPQSK